MKLSNIISVIIVLSLLSGCSSSKLKDKGIESPCVGAENSPCDFRSANNWYA